MIDFFEKFQAGRPYREFLKLFGTADQVESWEQRRAQVELTEAQTTLLESFSREINVLCMAGAWCGDCVQQCPIFDVFEQVASTIHIRFLDRDEDADLKDELKICGGSRVPQVVFLSEEGAVVGRYGDRTLTRYREMAASQFGRSFPSGAGSNEDLPTLQGVIQDWLNEFERIHLILRLSPRLRQIHRD